MCSGPKLNVAHISSLGDPDSVQGCIQIFGIGDD